MNCSFEISKLNAISSYLAPNDAFAWMMFSTFGRIKGVCHSKSPAVNNSHSIDVKNAFVFDHLKMKTRTNFHAPHSIILVLFLARKKWCSHPKRFIFNFNTTCLSPVWRLKYERLPQKPPSKLSINCVIFHLTPFYVTAKIMAKMHINNTIQRQKQPKDAQSHKQNQLLTCHVLRSVYFPLNFHFEV